MDLNESHAAVGLGTYGLSKLVEWLMSRKKDRLDQLSTIVEAMGTRIETLERELEHVGAELEQVEAQNVYLKAVLAKHGIKFDWPPPKPEQTAARK